MPRKLPSRVYKQYKFVRRETLSDAYGHHGHNFPLVLPFKVVLNASKSTATFGIPSTNNNGFSIKYLSQLPNSTFTSGTVDFASRLTQNVGLNIILDTNVTPRRNSNTMTRALNSTSVSQSHKAEYDNGALTRLNNVFGRRSSTIAAMSNYDPQNRGDGREHPRIAGYIDAHIHHYNAPSPPSEQRQVPTSTNPFVLSDTVPSEAVWTGTLPGWTPPRTMSPSDANY